MLLFKYALRYGSLKEKRKYIFQSMDINGYQTRHMVQHERYWRELLKRYTTRNNELEFV